MNNKRRKTIYRRAGSEEGADLLLDHRLMWTTPPYPYAVGINLEQLKVFGQPRRLLRFEFA